MKPLGLAPRQWLVATGTVIAAAAVLALIVAVAGVYNVSATSGHAPLVEPFLRMAMLRSVSLHSRGIEVPFDDAGERVPLGAAHFHVGCGNCHGYPGGHDNPIYEQMLPLPPTLNEAVTLLEDRELFWIVRHGLKYTGMPAWPGAQRDDEVWSVVAFLRELPQLEGATYRGMARGNAPVRPNRPEELPVEGVTDLRLSACARCHDTADAPPTSRYIPRLGGQSQTYLVAALRHYRSGERESGFMEPVAADLDDAEIDALARHYAALDSPVSRAESVADSVRLEHGRRLARDGVPDDDLPACDACHGPGALAAYPRLAGQPREYQVGQLELWQRGGRVGTPGGRTMAMIALRLEPSDIDAVAAYYSVLAPGATD